MSLEIQSFLLVLASLKLTLPLNQSIVETSCSEYKLLQSLLCCLLSLYMLSI
uniref:Uncharacterized protein n=1 Tax=Arundo donax TaxID=35708 RepID=A0A0A8YUV3_ARUDO